MDNKVIIFLYREYLLIKLQYNVAWQIIIIIKFLIMDQY